MYGNLTVSKLGHSFATGTTLLPIKTTCCTINTTDSSMIPKMEPWHSNSFDPMVWPGEVTQKTSARLVLAEAIFK